MNVTLIHRLTSLRSPDMNHPLTKNNRVSFIDVENSQGSLSDDSTSELPEKPKEFECKECGKTVAKLIGVSICGILFGISLEKARVFEPKSIRDQMVFENFIMLKMFLAAAASGQLGMAILSLIPKTRHSFEKASDEFVACSTDKGIFASAIGAFILGVGMTLCGACPGMVLIQVGANVPNAVFTFLGVLVGALVYGLLAQYIIPLCKPKCPFEIKRVYKKFKLHFAMLAIPMAIIMGIVVFVIEWFWPSTKDLESLGRYNALSSNVVTTVAWTPYSAGIVVGLLQVPIVLILQDTLGGSSGYVTVVSQWVVTEKLQRMFPYMASKRTGLANWWQVFFVVSAIVGGTVSAASSNSFSKAYGVPVHMSLLGGIAMLFGARLSAGCTSGHGLSGMALLAWLSILAVPCMFAGGIVTAFAMKATGALDTYVTSMGAVS